MYDIIIIGGGPAGLTSALYARGASKKVLVLEAKACGGQIVGTLDIENYPTQPHISGYDFAKKLQDQAIELGADIVFEKVIDIKDGKEEKEVITTKNTYKCKSIIIATGSDNRKLNLDNEDELLGKGISYCATCDGNFYKNKTVAVVGGGNTALEDALYLSDIAKEVYLIHRREEFRADKKTISRLEKKENVKFILNSNVTKLNAKDKLNSIEITDNDSNVSELVVDGLFVAVGRIPENQNFAKTIELNDAGYVIAGEDCHTNTEGIFVAGDNRVKQVRQLVTAASDGAIAAIEAIKYLGKKN